MKKMYLSRNDYYQYNVPKSVGREIEEKSIGMEFKIMGIHKRNKWYKPSFLSNYSNESKLVNKIDYCSI